MIYTLYTESKYNKFAHGNNKQRQKVSLKVKMDEFPCICVYVYVCMLVFVCKSFIQNENEAVVLETDIHGVCKTYLYKLTPTTYNIVTDKILCPVFKISRYVGDKNHVRNVVILQGSLCVFKSFYHQNLVFNIC